MRRFWLATTTALLILGVVGCADTGDDPGDDLGADADRSDAASDDADAQEPADGDGGETGDVGDAAGDDADAAEDPGTDAASGDDENAIGATATLGDYEVTVTDFVGDATEEVLGANQFNDQPTNGRYGTVAFDVTYLGDEEGSPGFDLTAVLVVDGVQHADYDCAASVENDAIQAPTLEHGGSLSGLVFCFDHPGVEGDASLFFQETFSIDDQRAYWALD